MNLDRKKRNTAALSVASNTILVIGKFIVGISINSVSVISEAVHSGIDLIAAVVAYFAVRTSSKPPDESHPFGHGKAEGISGAFEGLLILVAIGIIVYKAVGKLTHGAQLETVNMGLVVMGISAVMNAFVSYRLFRVSREADSLALEADAVHLSTDVFTSLGVFGGLLIIKFTGIHILDPLVALGVAVVIGHAAYDIIRRSIKDLMDEELSRDETDAIKSVLKQHRSLFIGFHDLRSRRSGSRREIDLHLVQCRETKLEDAHKVCDHIEDELQKEIPRAHIVIHVEPCDVECDGNRDKCQVDAKKSKVHITNP